MPLVSCTQLRLLESRLAQAFSVTKSWLHNELPSGAPHRLVEGVGVVRSWLRCSHPQQNLTIVTAGSGFSRNGMVWFWYFHYKTGPSTKSLNKLNTTWFSIFFRLDHAICTDRLYPGGFWSVALHRCELAVTQQADLVCILAMADGTIIIVINCWGQHTIKINKRERASAHARPISRAVFFGCNFFKYRASALSFQNHFFSRLQCECGIAKI